jgi:dephospho-CoA kinase
MKIKKIKVAITGGIGSGKSQFAKFISDKDYPVINVDEVSKQLLVSNKEIKSEIEKEFGEESYIKGEINKKFLAEKIFSNHLNVLKINSIVHPIVIEKVNNLIAEKLKIFNIVFAEAALIYEAEMEKYFDYVVLITAPEEIRLKRKIEIDNFSKEQFLSRNENQIPDEEKKKQADFIFENDGSLEELNRKADLLINILKALE